jgi:L-alanine-DL-glutamate epimerase-like enolase superfamily enzyme
MTWRSRERPRTDQLPPRRFASTGDGVSQPLPDSTKCGRLTEAWRIAWMAYEHNPDAEGYLHIPNKPGLGIELNREALKRLGC